MLTEQSLAEIAEICEISATEVASIVGFYSLYYDEPSGKYHIQVCTDLALCAARSRAVPGKAVRQPGHPSRVRPRRTGWSPSKHVMCLAACDKAPMFQVQTGEGLEYHENQTVDSALDLVEQSWRERRRGEV